MEPICYRIIDSHTKRQVGSDYTYARRNTARSRAEKLNQEYEAHRYYATAVAQWANRLTNASEEEGEA